MSKRIDILLCNHFDLTWRRCFRKPLDWQGRRWIPYARIQEFYIRRCLAMCEKDAGFRFNIESAAVLRQFLKSFPEKEAQIRELLAQGRLDLPFAGDNIIDSNLVQGESIIRNYLYGYRYLKGLGHDGGKTAYRRDSFGNSAQLPQILRGFGIDWVWALSYTEADAPLWVGLDGSRIYCEEPPAFTESGSIEKYAPCPVCRGTGSRDGLECAECEGKGIDWKEKRFCLLFPELPEKEEDYSLWTQRSEELIPPWEMLDWPEKMEEAYLGQRQEAVEVRFGTFSDLYAMHRKAVERAYEDPDTPQMSSCELNANNTGVYVSRIMLKKQCRDCEDRMFELEHLLVQAFEQGMEFPGVEMERLWEELLFLMFHDAVTGTIVDAAYEELIEAGKKLRAGIEKLFAETLGWLEKPESGIRAVFNPGLVSWQGILSVTLPKGRGPCGFTDMEGHPVSSLPWRETKEGWQTQLLLPEIRPMSQLLLREIPACKDAEPLPEKENGSFIENERFRVETDGHGIAQVLDKETGRRWGKVDGIRIHEIYLENDEGSPWTTLSSDRSRISLTEKTELSSVEKNGIYERFTFKSGPFNVNTVDGMELSWSVTLVRHCQRIDFSMDVEYWDTYNKRIRVAFPAPFSGRTLYDIPYGTLERGDYESACGKWDGACGDWPGVRFAGISSPTTGMAVINAYTPSYKTEHTKGGDVLLLSLLRSPCIPTYLHEPRSYNMRDYDGMRDTGRHVFSYALYLTQESLEESNLAAEAEAFCTRPAFCASELDLKEAVTVESGCIRLSACYPDGKGAVILRLFEYRGRGGEAIVRIPGNKKVFLCDLKEEILEELSLTGGKESGEIKIACRPFEIKTVKMVCADEV